ncbi:MAG TPA: ABC transporter substrate-binding protein [Pararhizobium sp.]|uniref:ABC transporter substrate-binding protein n=1 Tax=Pararhizobium sp. TaxID=1977563 RepID=UPI002BC15D8C|nr:ABC transporter substrate-binding protein [Pararhizobium sp.]HTO33137.1 ABC transporter substrate-binding protein [Pararhizobium sp.]
MFKIKSVLLAATALVSLAGPCLAEIKVIDIKGREVTLPRPAERIALGFYYEDYLAVAGPGAIDKVVALSLSTWKDWRPNQFAAYEKALPKLASIPEIGNTEDGTFPIEKLLATKPDLLILAAWSYDALGEGTRQIEAAGIPIVTLDYNAQTVEKHTRSTEILGKVTGADGRAKALAGMYRAAMEDIDARIRLTGPSGKKVYVELAQKGPSEVGNSYGSSMWGALIDKLGGINIAKGQIGNWGPLSPEFVLTEQPDLIFLAGSEWRDKPQAVSVGFGADPAVTRERMDAYLTRPGWRDLPAARNGEIHAIYHGGARTLSDYVYAQYIAKQLYPKAFEDVDPAENIRRYYEAWLPIKADGVFVLPYRAAGQ